MIKKIKNLATAIVLSGTMASGPLHAQDIQKTATDTTKTVAVTNSTKEKL
jgi:hypothetical protein